MKIPSRKIAILPCRGIGDALLILIAAERLRRSGYDVITCHPKLPEMQDWFPTHHFDTGWNFPRDAWLIVQNDNSTRVETLKKEQRERLSILYPTYIPSKNGPLSPFDKVFDATQPMAENIASAAASLAGTNTRSLENGITPPSYLIHRRCSKRVVLHHSSSTEEKNWPRKKFEEVAQKLQRRGFEPVFLPTFPSLSDLAAFIYESGCVIGNDSLVGHLASNLGILTVIVADMPDRMQLWRPGWLKGAVVTLPPWLAYWRLCQKNWKSLISSRRVLQAFDAL